MQWYILSITGPNISSKLKITQVILPTKTKKDSGLLKQHVFEKAQSFHGMTLHTKRKINIFKTRVNQDFLNSISCEKKKWQINTFKIDDTKEGDVTVTLSFIQVTFSCLDAFLLS